MGPDAISAGTGWNAGQSTSQNMQTNLVDQGNIGNLSGVYWTTESSVNPGSVAIAQFFSTGGGIQSTNNKNQQLGVRCVRAVTQQTGRPSFRRRSHAMGRIKGHRTFPCHALECRDFYGFHSRCEMVRSKSRSYVVRSSGIHGNGVFAKELIRKGSRIIEYRGFRSTIAAERRKPVGDPKNPHHTFLFELSDGRAIEGGVAGNAARWINHGCDPNCEAIEDDGRVFIHATRTIRPGDELTYDYRLGIPGRISERTRQAYACHCGAKTCRGSMLMESSER
jgi:hypothetical protein